MWTEIVEGSCKSRGSLLHLHVSVVDLLATPWFLDRRGQEPTDSVDTKRTLDRPQDLDLFVADAEAAHLKADGAKVGRLQSRL